MTYGNLTYGGAALGSTSDPKATTTATATTSTAAIVTGEGAAITTAITQTTATTAASGTGKALATADAQTTASTTTTSAGAAITTASTQTAAATIATDANLIQSAVEWRVTRDGTDVIDSVFDVDPVVDTANPFGDYAVAKMDDRGGELFKQFSRGTRLEAAYSTNGGISFTEKFTGYVVEPKENEQSGADVLEVEAYSFDQFLRRNTVTNDQTGNTIAEALQDIVTNDTPVSFVSGNVNVGDEQELTRSYRGRPVEAALRDLAFKSNNEEFGVNDDLEFFFRPQESTHIDRGVDDTQWFNYDIPELGKEAVNEVEVWFDDGNKSVVIDDSTDKLDLQDSLGLPEPGTQRAELQRPLITDISDAEDIGRKYLKFRNATLSGTVTTFGLFEAQPGDTIDVTITPRGIDTEFVIAATEYRWGRDETVLTIVERRGDIDDILTEINESVQRQEMEGADRDAASNRITTTNATAIVSIAEDSTAFPTGGGFDPPDRFVNGGRRAVRDAWTGDSPPDITTLVVGDGSSGLSRSNTELVNQTNSATVSQSLPDSKSVTFEATLTQSDVQEIGLEAADGTLITRTVLDEPIDLNSDTFFVTLTVSNDDSVSRGVLTNDGQTAIRDVLADNSPDLPTDYAYGSDDTAVSESDTALGNELVSVPLDKVLVQDADTQTEWEALLSITDTDPFYIESGEFRLAQTTFVQEGETDTISGTRADGDYSGGEATFIEQGTSNNGEDATVNFDLDYTIPESNVAINFRTEPTDGSGDGISDTPEFTVSIDGTTFFTEQRNTNNLNLEWRDFSSSWSGGDLTAGSHTLTIEVTDASQGTADDELRFDLFAVYDDRFNPTFDNSNDGSGGFLDGPELFPASEAQSFPTATTRRNVDEARFELTANDVSNNFYVELSGDGGSTFTRVNNSQTGNVTFADATQSIDTNVGLGRTDETRTTATPQTGFNGQTVDVWDLFVFPDAVSPDDIGETLTRGIVDPGTITGQTVRECGIKDGSVLLTRHLLAEFSVASNERIASAETTLFTSDN